MAIFLVADTHFDDKNAVEYHMRPFNDVEHMNETIVHNWNRVVSHDDTVIVLGDFTGPEVSYEKTADWSSILHGNKKFIEGVNDSLAMAELKNSDVYDSYKIENSGFNFYCTHNPNDIPDDWNEWTIHGHSHQLHPQQYPLINYKHKRINVSVEQIGYTPISLSAIIEMVKNISE
jgi:calcineurin-like phosphoesterase family protein